ncbi:MAG TPA: zf-HC2 domain-containing protein [Acidobacteriaceae bacterium]|nr:zf-HC2 domain-containing protein [Acidobacteriaceae bacterium]
MATNKNPEKGPRRSLSCEAWESMLTDALDGTLDARDAEAFDAHSKSCAAGCGDLLEQAKRGTEWLRFLHQTPEAPEGLLEKILVGTTGLPDAQQPLMASGAVALPRQAWLDVPIGLLQRHLAESRILMTLAMAFFSLALTLNLTGVHLNQLKLSDLKPSALAATVSHQYYTTSAHLTRYYSNLRIVYELESRVNEMRRDNSAPAARPASQPQPQKTQPQSSGKPGGSARRSGSVPEPEQRQRHYEAPDTVLARLDRQATRSFESQPQLELRSHGIPFSSGPMSFRSTFFSERPGNYYKPSERSLV